MSEALGRFKAVRLVRGGAVLEYTRARRASARVDDRRRERRTIGDRAQHRRRPRSRAVVADAGIQVPAGSMSLCRGTQAGLALESIPASGAAGRTRVGGEDPGPHRAGATLRRDVRRTGGRHRRVPGRSQPPRRRRAGRRRSRPRSRGRPRRTPTSWTTSRCPSTTPGAATCGPVTFSSSRTAPASA